VLKELRAMLAKWLPLPAVDDPIELTIDGFDACTARQGAPAADLNVLAALVGSDPAVIEEMLTAFRRSAARCSADIREALGDGNTAAANAAHTLKSGARSLGAQRLCDVCLDIEAAAEGRHPDGPTELLRRFDVALTALEEFLDPPRKAVHAFPA
jgi:HPt (histidine-containing phosphotransfer) domain-containing protein